jgi:hypothetical protein
MSKKNKGIKKGATTKVAETSKTAPATTGATPEKKIQDGVKTTVDTKENKADKEPTAKVIGSTKPGATTPVAKVVTDPKPEEKKVEVPVALRVASKNNPITNPLESLKDSKISLDTTVKLADLINNRYIKPAQEGKHVDPNLLELADSNMDGLIVLSLLKIRAECGNDVEQKLILTNRATSALETVCASYGIKLPVAKQLTGAQEGQKSIDFKEAEVPVDLDNAAKADVEKDKKIAGDRAKGKIAETVDPTKIENDEQLKASLDAILHPASGKFMTASEVASAINFLKTVRIFKAGTDKDKVAELEKRTMGDWISELIQLVGNVFLCKGISNVICNYITASGNALTAFLTTKKSFGDKKYSDESIADIMVALIESRCREQAIEKLKFIKTEDPNDPLNGTRRKNEDGTPYEPKEPEITQEMASLPSMKYLIAPNFDVKKILADYKLKGDKQPGSDTVDATIAYNKQAFFMTLDIYYQSLSKKLKTGTLTPKDEAMIEAKLIAIENLFVSPDEQIIGTEDESWSKKLIKKLGLTK